MNNMENIYLCNLYDYYSNLFTEKQKNYFEDYYLYNLTLSEMSENYEISRNAIHKNIKETATKLVEYEKKLHLYENNLKIKEILKEEPKILEKIEDYI